MADVFVSELNVYPIKSCRPAAMDQYEVGPYGLEHDREWILTRPGGLPLTQRTHPQLAVIETRVTDEALLVTAPRVGELALALHSRRTGEEREVDLFNKLGTGTEEFDEAHKYFSEFLGRDVTLLRAKRPRQINPEYQTAGFATKTNFADGFPFLLASHASLRELNMFSEHTVPMNRFRPNIVVDGPELEPYDEDYWRTLTIGALTAAVVRPCARCPMPDVDPEHGVLPLPADRYVKAALSRSRAGTEHGKGKSEVFFGQNLSHVFVPGTVLRVGDPVKIGERSSERNWTPPLAA